MKLAMKTDVGRVRENNQDAVNGGIWDRDSAWAAVCDGMGGANGGNIASQLGLEFISQKLKEGYHKNLTHDYIKNLLVSTLYNANQTVFEKSKTDPFLKGMGTTAVVALIKEQTLHIAHVGDSRAFLLHPGSIDQITKDHTIVQSMVDAGRITEEEAREHPQKHIITRAIGVNQSVSIDYYEAEFHGEDILLLCSDGLTNHVRNEKIVRIIREAPFELVAEQLVQAALDAGGTDNVTVAVVANDTQEAK